MIKIGKISSFDLLKLQKDYITRALNEVPGRKVLILDKTTEKSLSQIYTVSELWEFDVYLIESINKMTEEKDQNSLQTIMMIQPSAQNIDSICREISSFKYTDTFIYFVNEVEPRHLEQLGVRDAECGKIQVVKEIYCDYYLINRKTFSLNLRNEDDFRFRSQDDSSMCSQLYSLLLSVRLSPFIYYSSSSTRCQSLATRLSMMMLEAKSNLQREFVEKYDSVLIVVDRNDDKITPLRLPWHYQSMVYEHSNFANGKISLSKESEDFQEFQEIQNYNITEAHDEFFAQHVCSDFGKIAQESTNTLKNLKKSNPAVKDMSTEEMKEVIDKLPELKKKRARVIKHIDIVSDLTDKIKKHHLIKLRDLEDAIFDNENIDDLCAKLIRYLNMEDIRPLDKLRIALIFSLVHFKRKAHTDRLLQELQNLDLDKSTIEMIRRIHNSRLHLYKDIPDKEQNNLSGLFSFLGVQDHQEEPYLCKLVTKLIEGNVDDSELLPADKRFRLEKKPGGIIVFVVGGMSLEESVALQKINKRSKRVNIISGGTHILTIEAFLEQLKSNIVQ